MHFSGDLFKVYVNDKVIRFSKEPSAGYAGSIIEMSNGSPEDLWNTFTDFVFVSNASDLTLLSDNPGKLMGKFSESFEMIEAAGGLVKNPKGKLLVIFRWNKWDLPKGKLNKNELPWQAALREVKEECGLQQLKIGQNLTCTFHAYPLTDKKWALKRTHWFKMASDDNSHLIPQEEEGIEKACWIESAQLPLILSNTYKSLEEIFEKAFT